MPAQTPLQLLPVAPRHLTWGDYQIASYTAGAGRPVVLLHSINAAASAFEMRAPFAGLRDDFAVHALDLLGYGNSDRPARAYVPEDYIALIGDYLAHIGEPAALVASSLSATYAISAAFRWPERVSALLLVCPVGIRQLAKPAGPVGRAFHRFLYGTPGRLLFRLLTTRAGTRYFLRQQAYHDPRCITPAVHEGFYRTCRRPGAHYAPICFLTGLLNCQIGDTFAALRQPTMIVWGKQATTTPPRQAQEFLRRNPRARLEVVDGASLLVQDEQPAQFNALARDFLLLDRARAL